MSTEETLQPDIAFTTIEEQAAALKAYSEYVWEGRFSPSEIDEAAEKAGSPEQHLGAVTVLHAEFNNPTDTILHWRNAYFRSMWMAAHWNGVPLDDYTKDQSQGSRFIRLHEHAQRYEPGIHPVTVDMTYGIGISGDVAEIRKKAISEGRLLAHGEVLSVIGLHRALRKSTSGQGRTYVMEHHPYLPGYEANDEFYARQRPEIAWKDAIHFDDSYPRGEDVGLRQRRAEGEFAMRNSSNSVPTLMPEV